jgi:hypothetical protein
VELRNGGWTEQRLDLREEVRGRLDAVVGTQREHARALRRLHLDQDGRGAAELLHELRELADDPGTRLPRVDAEPNVPALGNVAAGSLLFGQFLSDRPYSPMLALIGLTTWVGLFGIAFVFAAKE